MSAFGAKVSNNSADPDHHEPNLVSIEIIGFGSAEATIEAVGHMA